MLGVDPVVYVLLPKRGFALGNLVFVVRETVVDAAGVDVETLS